MKAVWGFGLGILLLGSAQGSEEGTPVKAVFGGQSQFRMEASDRTDGTSKREGFFLRIRPEVRLNRGDHLSFYLQPQFAHTLGAPAFVPTGANTNAPTFFSGSVNDPSLLVHQGYLDYRPAADVTLWVGRQELKYGDELALSPLGWNNVSRSFDALRARYHASPGDLDLFFSKLVETNATSTSLGVADNYLAGAYASGAFGEGFDAVDLYLLYRRAASTAPAQNLYVVGARLKAKLSEFDYRCEVTQEFGTGRSSDAYQADLEVGYLLNGAHRVRVAAEGFIAGANFDQLYPLAHKYLGIADVLGRRNLLGGAIHLTAQPFVDLTAQLDLHYFGRHSTTRPVYKVDGSAALGTGADPSSGVGTEVDVLLTYKLLPELSLTVGGGVFVAGGYFTAEVGNFNPTFAYAQLNAHL